jgi:hypothetical protein
VVPQPQPAPLEDRWIGGTSVHLRHEALITLARKVCAAADDGDPVRLERAAVHLLDALTSHLSDEAIAMAALPPVEARGLQRGQRHLLSLAAKVVEEAARGCVRRLGYCSNHSEDLLAQLMLQARDERVALDDPTA